jgi:hypothetical protein
MNEVGRINGVFGDELLVDVATGECVLRSSVVGRELARQHTNAFTVWVGRVVAVVSEGVSSSVYASASLAIREFLGFGNIPVVFRAGGDGSVSSIDVLSDECDRCMSECAMAEVYVSVQCGLVESDVFHVDVGGQVFAFVTSFVSDGFDGLIPVVIPCD